MRTIKKLTDNKFLNIKEVADSDMHVKAYQFAERRGVDSVAFICVKIDENKRPTYLLNHECTPPTGEMLDRAFGGSLDKEKALVDIVIGEVREEAGYVVTTDNVFPLGKTFVSTQMNQYCHLFLVMVLDSGKIEREPENECEATSTPIWKSEDEITNGSDWKSITIMWKAKWNGIVP